MKSKELMVYNLPDNTPMIGEIDAKPTLLFVLFLVLGSLSFLTNIPIQYSVMIIIVSLFAIIFMPKVVLMQFFSDFLVMYNKADKNTCELIYYEDVVSWHYSWSANRDYLYIELKDGQTEKIEAFSKTIFEYNMNRFLKTKRKKSK